jgi:hypothetical protein
MVWVIAASSLKQGRSTAIRGDAALLKFIPRLTAEL